MTSSLYGVRHAFSEKRKDERLVPSFHSCSRLGALAVTEALGCRSRGAALGAARYDRG